MGLTQVNSEGIKDGEVKNADMADDAVGIAELSATGTASSSTYLRGDNSWATVSAGTALTGSTNNTICTVTGANAIQGEANLTFDGSDLTVVGEVQIGNTSNHTKELRFADSTRVDASSIKVDNSTANLLITNDRGGGEIKFACDSTERVSIDDTGDLKIADGDLVIGTSGHGIDFSANSHTGGKQSELLDHYEEGTWSPTFANLANATLNTNTNGEYIRIGSLVYIRCWVGLSSITGGQSWILDVGGFPFTANSGGYGRYPFAINAYGLSFGSDRQAIYSAMGESGTVAQIMSTDGTNPNVSTSQVTANNCTGGTSFYLCGSYHVLGY